jgi:hypothetical protein
MESMERATRSAIGKASKQNAVMTKTSAALAWDNVKARLREWSPVEFVFEAFLSLLIPYVIYLVTAIAWYQLVILVLLTFGALTSGMLYWEEKQRAKLAAGPGAADLKDRLMSLVVNREHLLNLAKMAPDTEAESDEFWAWYRTTWAFLSGAYKPEIVGDFEAVADRTKNPRSCRQYLIGLATNLGQSDMRRSRDGGKDGDPWT